MGDEPIFNPTRTPSGVSPWLGNVVNFHPVESEDAAAISWANHIIAGGANLRGGTDASRAAEITSFGIVGLDRFTAERDIFLNAINALSTYTEAVRKYNTQRRKKGYFGQPYYYTKPPYMSKTQRDNITSAKEYIDALVRDAATFSIGERAARVGIAASLSENLTMDKSQSEAMEALVGVSPGSIYDFMNYGPAAAPIKRTKRR